MKILSIILSLCLTLNVLAASTGPLQELEKQIDEFHYTLAVEWDQKDQAFYNAQTDAFLAKVSTLIKSHGVSKDDILAMSEKKIKNKAAFEAIKLKMSLLGPQASVEELVSTLRDSSKDFYAQGASWIGGMDPILTSFIALFVIAIGYSIWWSATHECAERGQEYQCDRYMACAGYYNAYGECIAYVEEQDCGYVSVCLRWVKKQ